MHSIKDLSYLIAKHIECIKTFLLIEALQKKNKSFNFNEVEEYLCLKLTTAFGFIIQNEVADEATLTQSDDENISYLIYNYLLNLSEDWKDKLSIQFFDEISSKKDPNINYHLVKTEIHNLVQKLIGKALSLGQHTLVNSNDIKRLLDLLYSMTQKVLNSNSKDQISFVEIALLFEEIGFG